MGKLHRSHVPNSGVVDLRGFESRKTLHNYEGRPEFLPVIKKAKALIEAEVESRLFGANCTGSIFWLKNNAEYRDKTDIEHSGGVNVKIVRFSSD